MIREVTALESKKLLDLCKKEGITFTKGILFGMFLKSELVSIASITFDKKNPKLKTAYTLPKYRKRGIGTKMLMFRLYYLKSKGYNFALSYCKKDSLGIHLKAGAVILTEYQNKISKVKHNLSENI
jgi:GNAT superfamily N-acetyltransferase